MQAGAETWRHHETDAYRLEIQRAADRSWAGGGIAELEKIVEAVADIPGDMAELGSYRAGGAMVMAIATRRYARDKLPKRVFAFDTFSGLPEPSRWDLHKKADFGGTDWEEIQQACRPYKNLHLVKGEFKNTLPGFGGQWSLVFLDCDLYESTRVALHHFWPIMAEGGLIVVDDYMFPGTPGVTKAVQEFFAPRQLAKMKNWHPFRVIPK